MCQHTHTTYNLADLGRVLPCLAGSGPISGVYIVKGWRASHGHALQPHASFSSGGVSLGSLGEAGVTGRRGWAGKGAVVALADYSLHQSAEGERVPIGSRSKYCPWLVFTGLNSGHQNRLASSMLPFGNNLWPVLHLQTVPGLCLGHPVQARTVPGAPWQSSRCMITGQPSSWHQAFRERCTHSSQADCKCWTFLPPGIAPACSFVWAFRLDLRAGVPRCPQQA